MFCRSMFVLLSFFIWPLCCRLFFDIRILISLLVPFGHCVVDSSSIYGFWLPLWYLQPLLDLICFKFFLTTTIFFIEVPVPNQKGERSYICVLRLSIFFLFLWFWYFILGLFRECGIFCIHLISLIYLFIVFEKGARVAQWVRSLDLTAHRSLSPIRVG